MNIIILSLASLSAKILLLGAIVWGQLYLLRRAPAASRSRLCAITLFAILLLAAGEMLSPHWMVRAPIHMFTVAATRGAAHAHAQLPSPERWIALVWIAGVAFMLLRAIAGRVALAIVRRRSTPLRNTGGIDTRIADVQTPILTGWVRPIILLPEAASQWTAEQRQMVLTHELTHYRRGDLWTNLVAQTLRAVFWFHPVVWATVSRLSREQELACDEAVVSSGHSPHDYAAFLLATARSLKSREMFACAMAGSGAQSLKERFANLLDRAPRRLMTHRIILSMTACALAAIALLIVHPVWSQSVGPGQVYPGQVYKVGDGVTQPAVLYKVEPKYSDMARQLKVSGSVLLKLIITPEGEADAIEVVRGVGYGLDEAAIDAVSQWKFQPGTMDGKPVAVWATVEVNFRLL